ncbi:MAG TPA: transposase, partial [Planctomycetota bacterium]|nr:transposase [Planctomycetota bacterium]
AASIRELVAMSDPLRKVAVLGRESDEWVEPKYKPTCARVKEGYSVHANVRIEGNDREGLAQLCRYITRPPFAMDRIRESGDGRIVVELRRPRMDRGTALLLTEQELMEKLAALVPPPRAHLVRYHGVLAPHARARIEVVRRQKKKKKKPDSPADGSPPGAKAWIPWAELLEKTFGVDALECPRCGHRMRVVAFITEPRVIRRILRSMGIAPPMQAAGADPPGSAEGGSVWGDNDDDAADPDVGASDLD